MTSILKAIDSWWGFHPHVVELGILALTLFVSLFPGVSRRLVGMPMRYSLLGVFRLMQRDAKSRLDIVRLVDGSAFKLIAYIGYYCLHALYWSLITSAIGWVGFNAYSHWLTRDHTFIPFTVLFFGALLGRGIKLYSFLGGLLNPEKTIPQLEKMVAGERLE